MLLAVLIPVSGVLSPPADPVEVPEAPNTASMLLDAAEALVAGGEYEAALDVLDEATRDPALQPRIAEIRRRIDDARIDAALADDPEVRSPDPVDVAATVAPDPTDIELRRTVIVSTPPGQVFIDDSPMGTAPVALEDLADGDYRVEVQLEGHTTEVRTLTIPRGQDVPLILTIALQPEVEAPSPVPPPPVPVVAPEPVVSPAPVLPPLGGRQVYDSSFALHGTMTSVRRAAEDAGMSSDLARAATDELESQLHPNLEAGGTVAVDADRLLRFLLDEAARGTGRRALQAKIRRAQRDGLLD